MTQGMIEDNCILDVRAILLLLHTWIWNIYNIFTIIYLDTVFVASTVLLHYHLRKSSSSPYNAEPESEDDGNTLWYNFIDFPVSVRGYINYLFPIKSTVAIENEWKNQHKFPTGNWQPPTGDSTDTNLGRCISDEHSLHLGTERKSPRMRCFPRSAKWLPWRKPSAG